MKKLASILVRAAVSAILLLAAAVYAFAAFHIAPGWLNIVIMLAWVLFAVVLLAWTLAPAGRED